MVRTSREVSSRDLHCNSTSSGLEHVPAKCTHFADKNMLQHIDPGALSYRRNGSISTESALARGAELVVLASHEALGRLDRNRGIPTIGIGADRLGEFLVQGRAADQHDIIVAHPL